MSFTALLVDIGGQTANMEFFDASSPAKISTFCAAHSSAGLSGVNELTPYAVSVTAAAATSDIQKKALIFGKYGNGSPAKIVVPSPVNISVESTSQGERITKVSGQAVCDAYAALFPVATTIKFNYGYIREAE